MAREGVASIEAESGAVSSVSLFALGFLWGVMTRNTRISDRYAPTRGSVFREFTVFSLLGSLLTAFIGPHVGLFKPEVDARVLAVEALQNSTTWNGYHESERALNDMSLWLDLQEEAGKATAAVLLCMTEKQNVCSSVQLVIEQQLRQNGLEHCMAHMKVSLEQPMGKRLGVGLQAKGQNSDPQAEGHDSDLLSASVQSELVQTLQKCQKAVVLFEGLDKISLGEARAFRTAISERGSFFYEGKTYPANEALYLFSMEGNINDRKLGTHALLHRVRDQVEKRITNGEENREVAKSFRRRIDLVFPLTDNGIKPV